MQDINFSAPMLFSCTLTSGLCMFYPNKKLCLHRRTPYCWTDVPSASRRQPAQKASQRDRSLLQMQLQLRHSITMQVEGALLNVLPTPSLLAPLALNSQICHPRSHGGEISWIGSTRFAADACTWRFCFCVAFLIAKQRSLFKVVISGFQLLIFELRAWPTTLNDVKQCLNILRQIIC